MGRPTTGSIRAAVEASHAHLHKTCSALKRDKVPSGPLQAATDTDSIQESLKTALEENKSLCKRVTDLLEIRQGLKDKVDSLESKVEVLLKKKAAKTGGNSDAVSEIIRNIEAERDVYKTHVERLLDKLEPNRDKGENPPKGSSKNDENSSDFANVPLDVTPKVVVGELRRDEAKEAASYTPTAYRSVTEQQV